MIDKCAIHKDYYATCTACDQLKISEHEITIATLQAELEAEQQKRKEAESEKAIGYEQCQELKAERDALREALHRIQKLGLGKCLWDAQDIALKSGGLPTDTQESGE